VLYKLMKTKSPHTTLLAKKSENTPPFTLRFRPLF